MARTLREGFCALEVRDDLISDVRAVRHQVGATQFLFAAFRLGREAEIKQETYPMTSQVIRFTGPEFIADHSVIAQLPQSGDPMRAKATIYAQFTLLRGWLKANAALSRIATIHWHTRERVLEINLWSPYGDSAVWATLPLIASRCRRQRLLGQSFATLETLATSYYAGAWGYEDGAALPTWPRYPVVG